MQQSWWLANCLPLTKFFYLAFFTAFLQLFFLLQLGTTMDLFSWVQEIEIINCVFQLRINAVNAQNKLVNDASKYQHHWCLIPVYLLWMKWRLNQLRACILTDCNCMVKLPNIMGVARQKIWGESTESYGNGKYYYLWVHKQCVKHTPSRWSGGMPPQENFEK